jgi:hypothetical protein
MNKNSIFPCFFFLRARRSLGAWSLLIALSVPTLTAFAAPDLDADLQSRKPVHEQALAVIEAERLEFQKAIAAREEECLQRFLSARCMDVIRTDYLSAMRSFDLRREQERQALRTIDAEIRQRTRERRLVGKQD